MRRLFCSILALAGMLVIADSAYAAPTNYLGVFGNADTHVYVGLATIGGKSGIWIVERRDSDKACWTQRISSTSSLSGDWTIQLGSGWNDVLLMRPSITWDVCGAHLSWGWTYNGHYLDVYGGGGDDHLSVWMNGDSYAFGQDGDDEIEMSWYSRSYADGGIGNDVIWTSYHIDNERVFGGEDDDWVCDLEEGSAADAYELHGNSGHDYRRGNADIIDGFQEVVSVCPGE